MTLPEPSCANCGSTRGTVARNGDTVCADCDWPVGRPVPRKPFCSICRRRHAQDGRHPSE